MAILSESSATFRSPDIIGNINYISSSSATKVYLANENYENFLKKLFVTSEDGRFISSKSGVDPRRNHGARGVTKKVPTDGQTAFCLYIVED